MGSWQKLGFGTGVNLKYYNYSQITHLSLIDVKLDKTGLAKLPPNASVTEGSAEQLPFEENWYNKISYLFGVPGLTVIKHDN